MITKLGIQPFSLIGQIVNFLILLFVLSKFLYKPILKKIDEHKKRVNESLENSRKIEEEIKKLEEKKAEAIELAKKEAATIIKTANDEVNMLKQQLTEEAKKDAKQIKQQAILDFEEEKKKMLADFKTQTAWLVMATTKEVLKNSLKHKEQRALIKNVLNDMKNLKNVETVKK